jgi:AcrR family transcriptional regulator
LLETARAQFVRDGYRATSLERVAEEAGFSKGAVYSNFRNKDELFLAVMDEVGGAEIKWAVQHFGNPDSVQEALAGLTEWADRILGSESWTTLGVEAVAAARINPELRARLADRDAAVRGVITMLLENGVRRGRAHPLLPAESLASILLAVGVGLGLQRAVEPAVEPGLLVEAIRALVRPADSDHADSGQPE